MQIPPKSQKGALIRTWLVDAVDRLIDCVTALRLRPGPGIAVKETPAGTIISLKDQRGQPRMSAPAAMVCAGNGMRIDNGTASSVYVPGATASSVPVNGATFTCLPPDDPSGSDNFWFFPDYGETPVPVLESGTVYPVNDDMWLIGSVGLYKKDSTGFPSYINLHIMNSAGTTIARSIMLFSDTGTFSNYNSYNNFSVPVCLPIHAGYSIRLIASGSVSFDLSLYHV